MGQLIATFKNSMKKIHAQAEGPSVVTTHGELRGKTVTFGWGKADTFYGIPYAQSPVGTLRFEKPQRLKPWQGVRDAVDLPPMAIPWVRPANWESPEVRQQYSEDCLYLNLFRPADNRQQTRLLPVLAIIHGGGFQQGSARRYSDLEEIGRKYLSRGILVVVIQFRIGVFGYASSGEPEFGGNFAYWDQTEALRWLQGNLAAFGGDPARITLFGYSSGSTSVSSLAISPHSKDLFAQCIQMSGSVMMRRAASELVVEETRKMAETMGYRGMTGQDASADEKEEHEDLKAFLKNKSLEQFFDAIDKIGSTRVGLNYVKFGPRLDDDFLPADFPELIGQAEPKPTMIGLTEMEPLHSVLFGKNTSLHWDAIPWDQFATFGRDNFEEYIRRVVIQPGDFEGPERDELVRNLMDFYLRGDAGDEQQKEKEKGEEAKQNKDEPSYYLERLVEVMADLQFIVPHAWEVRMRVGGPTFQQQNRRLFAYVNKYANPRWFPPEVGNLRRAFHDNDHSCVFRNPSQGWYEFDADDMEIERHLNEFIANFVITSDPSTQEIKWHAAEPGPHPLNRHMIIRMPRPEMSADEFEYQRRLDFWDGVVANHPYFNLVLGRKSEPKPDEKEEGGEKEDGRKNGEGGQTGGMMGAAKVMINTLSILLLLSHFHLCY